MEDDLSKERKTQTPSKSSDSSKIDIVTTNETQKLNMDYGV